VIKPDRLSSNLACSARAGNFDLFGTHGPAYDCLSQFLSHLSRIDFTSMVADSSKNNGQMRSDFESAFKKLMVHLGASGSLIKIPGR